MQEIWKDIVGYEGLYQISNLGNVRSLNYNHTGKVGILKGGYNPAGYRIVLFNTADKGKNYFTIHRLVAQTFIPNPENKPCIDHINGDRSDNRVENLRWVTQEENQNFPLAKKNKSQSQINDSKKSKTVLQLDINTGEVINEFPSGKEVERQLGLDQAHISACCNGKARSAGGYIWKYK